MIYILCPGLFDSASTIVASALERSCGRGQVCKINLATWILRLQNNLPGILLVIHPLEEWSDFIIQTLQAPRNKVILFGPLPFKLADYLNAQIHTFPENIHPAADCQPAPIFSDAQSDLVVEYRTIDRLIYSPLTQRPFVRYDFSNEWNNLGYGAIKIDFSIWSLCQAISLPNENCLAHITLHEKIISAYAGLWQNVLWFNRAVGPVDSHEWYIVENYLAHFSHQKHLCQPIFLEVPHGYDAAVTMRLDCDENVESARALWNVYQMLEVPFSLALHTRLLDEEHHHTLPREILAQGGAILSHTATHAANWGGSYNAAFEEAYSSAIKIKSITGQTIRYAVSPFHHTPIYARLALADAGYEGCIGGIICNDPDYVMARSGVAPDSPQGFIGHTQQCMLHGDCLQKDDPLIIYKQAFNLAQQCGNFFGYLDHPFSTRYQYGWENEQIRVKSHIHFIQYMRTYGNVLFTNESDALDFLQDRSNIIVQNTHSHFYIKKDCLPKSSWKISAQYKEQSYAISNNEMVL
jgi:hypothetical protein